MSINKLVNGANETWFYGPVLLPFYDGSPGLRAGQIAYDQIGVIVPDTPGMVYWDGENWVQFGVGGSAPTLQEVTTSGNVTDKTINSRVVGEGPVAQIEASANLGASLVMMQASRGDGIDGAAFWMQGQDIQFIVSTGVNLRIINDSAEVLMTILADGSGYVDRNSVSHRSGSGTPEGVISAAPGSTWSRINGAPGETFYIKQSGTGNTGWAPIA